MTKSVYDKCIKAAFRCMTRMWLKHRITNTIIMVTLLVFCYQHNNIKNRVSILLFEINVLRANCVALLIWFIQYGVLTSLAIATLYAILRYGNFSLLGMIKFQKSSKNDSTSSQPKSSESESHNYSSTKESTYDSKSYNEWKDTIENCWCTLNIASMRLNDCKEKIAVGVSDSKSKLQQIRDNVKILEEQLQEQHAVKTDVGSNTDIVDDYFQQHDFVNFMNPEPKCKTSNSSSLSTPQSSDLSDSDESQSQLFKYNLVQQVLKIQDDLQLKTTNSETKRDKTMDCLQLPIEVPPIPAIQQWSMPKEIFSLSYGSVAREYAFY